MRDIKFRGLRADGGGWVYGWYQETGGKKEQLIPTIVVYNMDDLYPYSYHDVKPETVGQFTGLKDEDGNDIYEGDTVRYFGRQVLNGKKIYPIRLLQVGVDRDFHHCCYNLLNIQEGGEKLKVCGNIHQQEA